MVAKGLSGVGVVKKDRLIGQCSMDDLVLVAKDPYSLDQPIKHFSKLGHGARPPVTCSINISVHRLLELFVRSHTRRVFAVHSLTNEVLGVATLSQFFRLLVCGETVTDANNPKKHHDVQDLIGATAK